MFGAQEKPEDVARSCTNVFCILPIFTAVGFLVWAYYYAVDHGSLLELTGLPNGKGLICGVSESVGNQPFLYMCPDVNPSRSSLVCVPTCPTSIEGQTAAAYCDGGQPDYPSIPIADKVCFPTDSDRFVILNHLAFRLGVDSFLASMVEVQKSWPALFLSGLLVLALSAGYLRLFSSNPAKIFWVSASALTVVLGLIGLASVINAVQMELELGDMWDLLDNMEFLLGAAALITVITFQVTVTYQRHNLHMAFQAMKAVGEASNDAPSILTEPMISAGRKAFLLINFGVGLMFFVSCFDRVSTGNGTFEIHYKAKELWILFGFVMCFAWVYEYSTAMSCFVYAYMTEMWYYSPVDDKEFEGSGLLCDAYFNIARYHIGSLAYGSLLIFIFRPLRVVLDVLTRPIRKAEEDDENCCVWAVSKVNCCRKGCEKLVGFYKEYLRPLRRSAYMDMAMTGHDFQQSSRDANYFLDGRTVNVSEFDGAALLVATACSFFVSALGAALVRLMCAAWPDYSSTTSPNYVMLPTFVTFLSFMIGMLISWPFFLMPDHVADSMFYCFCRDRHAGDIGKSPEERQALNRGCNFQSLWGGGSTSLAMALSNHPEETQKLYETYESMR